MSKKTITIKAKIYKPTSKGSDKGMKVELEHTPNKRLARIIAANHEDEDPSYYKAKRDTMKKVKYEPKDKASKNTKHERSESKKTERLEHIKPSKRR